MRARTLHLLAKSVFPLVLSLWISEAIFAYAQETSAAPRAVFSEKDVELPPKLYNKEFTHPFVVKNGGAAPLLLTLGRRSCSCVAALSDERPIAPGEERVMNIGYSPKTGKEKHGRTSFSVEVLTNDPAIPRTSLSVSAVMVHSVEIEPDSIDFGVVGPGESPPRTLEIRRYSTADKFPRILSVTSDTPAVEILLIGEEKKDGCIVRRYSVSLVESQMPDVLEATVSATTDSDQFPVVEARISAKTPSALESQPKAFLMGLVKPGERRSKTVRLVLNDATAPRPAHARCTDPRVEVSLAEESANGAYALSATFTADATEGSASPLVEVFDAQGKRISSARMLVTTVGAD